MLTPEQIAVLSHVAQGFHSSLDLDGVLENVLGESVAASHATHGTIFLYDSQPHLYPRERRVTAPLRQLADRVMQQGVASASQDFFALGAPLRTRNEIIGVVTVERGSAFESTELESLSALAQPAALAIQNARLYGAAQAKLKNLRLLQEISADLTSTLDLDGVLTESLRRVQGVLQVDNATILFREGDELVFRIAIGVSAERIKPYRLRMGQGITGWVAQNARADFANDVPNDPRYYRTVDTEIKFVTHSLIAAPLVVNDIVIGVLSATNKPGGFNPADLDLLTTIAGPAAIAIENARLYQVAVEKGRMERELQVAREVQASLIPRQTPNLRGWDIAGMWQPAREVSGDYYDFVSAANQFDIVIADVSDKGMPAALLMTQTRSIIRANLLPARALARGITRANGLVCASSGGNMFVTMACVRLDAKSGRIACVNAGHNRPIICRARSGELLELSRTGIALGIDASKHYGQRLERLQRGDFVVLYTDGVTEAMNSDGEMFGEERWNAAILEHRRAGASEIIAAFERGLKEFIGAAAPADDITVVVAKKV